MLSTSFPKAAVALARKTGYLTKDTWEEFLFPGGTRQWKNRAWSCLVQRKYFLPYSNTRIKDVFVLNRHNKEIIEYLGGLAAYPPPASQIDHDEILNKGLLRADRAGVISAWTTEPELKSLGREAFRIESQGQLIKYPDALIQIGDRRESNSRWAVELEKTLKNKSRYVQIMSAYSGMKGISGILFVYSDLPIADAIEDAAERVFFPRDEIKLAFVPMKEWQAGSDDVLRKNCG